jgi:hypothetical protein
MLTSAEQTAYINAELCLMAAPSKLNAHGAETRWDDLQLNHVVQTNVMHDVVSAKNLTNWFSFILLTFSLRVISCLGIDISSLYMVTSCVMNATILVPCRTYITPRFLNYQVNNLQLLG